MIQDLRLALRTVGILCAIGGFATSGWCATIFVNASNVGVENGTLANPYNTIQEGVNAAVNGDTVSVAAGLYEEQVDFLGKNISVIGAGAESTTIRTPAVRTVNLTRTDLPSCSGARAVDPVVWIAGTTNAVLRGFTIDGNNSLIFTFSGTPVRTVGVGFKAARATIDACRVQRVRDPSCDGCQGGIAIYVVFSGSNVSITNNFVVDCQKGGIVINGHKGPLQSGACTAGDAQTPHAQITGNIVVGQGHTWAIAFNGIQVGFGADAIIDNNIVTGCYYQGSSAASGALLLVGSGPCSVLGNTLTGSNVGIYASDIDLGLGNIPVGAGLYAGNVLNNPLNGDPLSYASNALDDNAGSVWSGNTYSDYDAPHGFPNGYDIPFASYAGNATSDPSATQLAALDWTNLTGPTATATGADPEGVAVADVNGDGFQDVITANESSNSVSVLLNNGSGALLPAVTTTSALNLKGARSVVVGDFTGSSALDLAVACKAGNTVTILAGNGVGGFSIATTIPLSTGPYAIAAGDVEGDGDLDLAVALAGTPFFTPGGVSVLGNGPFGTFTSSALAAPGSGFGQVGGIAIADVGGTSAPEVIATDSDKGNLLIYANSAGTFGSPTVQDIKLTPTEVVKPRGVLVRDMNFDRRPDIVVTNLGDVPNNFGDVRVVMHAPSTAIAFGAALGFETGTFPTAVAAGNLHEDLPARGAYTGDDLVTANFGGSTLTQLNGYNGMVTPSASIPRDGSFLTASDVSIGVATAVAIADLNNDGFSEVVATTTGATGQVHVFGGRIGALAEPYGHGCAGTGGTIPVNGAIGLPTLGNSGFVDALTNAAPFKANFLAIGLGTANAPYGPALFDCFLLVNPSPLFLTFSGFTDATGSTPLALPIPNAPVLTGVQVYTQWIVFDSAGPAPGVVFSNGLRLRLGF